VLGVYFLLGPSADPDRFSAYVGEVGRRTLLTRIKEHAVGKDWWSRALLIASANDGFNSAEIGWLEGRLYDVLNNAVAADVMNKGRPGDDSIDPKDRGVLERYVEPIMAALRACGTPPDTADQKPAPKPTKRAYYRESVKDLIDANLLKPGTRLRPMRKTLTTPALVLDDGSLQVGGQVFSAVSPAAQAVSGNKSEPGWEFWGAPSGDGSYVALFALRARLREEKKNGAPSAPEADQLPAPATPNAGADADPDSTDAPIARSPSPIKRTKRRFTETVKDLLDGGLLSPGAELRSVRRAHQGAAFVLEDGRLRIGDEIYSSLSSAAQAVSGNKSEPGWEFWATDVNGKFVTLYELRAEFRENAAATS
jgi:hypothetical protein